MTSESSGDTPEPIVSEESTGDAELDLRLSEPVLKGEQGLDAAQGWIAAFIVAMTVIVAYSNAYRLPLHWADLILIQENTALHSPTSFAQALQLDSPGPLAMLTLAAQWWIFGDSVLAFRLFNVALHIANAALLLFLCRTLNRKGSSPIAALVAASLFALHPLATESVNYLVGRGSLLATFFTLLSILLYVRGTEDPNQIDWRRIAWSALAIVAAWASDASGLVAPLLILLIDWFRDSNRNIITRIRTLAASFAVAGMLLAVQATALAPPRLALSPSSLLDTWGVVFGRASQLILAPMGQSVDHGLRTATEFSDVGVSQGLIAFGAAVVAGAVLSFMRIPVGLSLLWVSAGALIPFVFSSRSENFSEQFVYLSLAGLVLCVPWLIERGQKLHRGRLICAFAGVALMIACGAATFSRNMLWQDELTLWNDAAAKAPESLRAANVLGELYLDRGESALARARAVSPEEVAAAAEIREEARFNFSRAEDAFRRALDLNPYDAANWRRLGTALSALVRPDEAIDAINRCLHLDTRDQAATILVADLLMAEASNSGSRDDFVRSLELYRRAESIGPLRSDTLIRFALALASNGDWLEADARLQQAPKPAEKSDLAARFQEIASMAARIRDTHQRAQEMKKGGAPESDLLRASIQSLMAQGMHLDAFYRLETLLEGDRNDFIGWLNLGVVMAHMNAAEQFVKEWPQAPAPSEGTEPPWIQLAKSVARAGDWHAVEIYLSSDAAAMQGVSMPYITLADIALDYRDVERANEFLNRATQAYPESPASWLRLCDMAIAGSNHASATRFIAEAEKRGALAEDIASRKEKIKEAPASQTPEQVILR